MGYNISETSGAVGSGTAGLDIWTFTVDLSDPSVTTVTGDFDAVPLGGGGPSGDPANGYSFGTLSTTAFGTLTATDPVNGTFTFTIDRAAVLASGSDQAVSFTILGDDGTATDQDTVVFQLLICLARGTLVETADGPRPVETLAAGDLVLTRDRGMQPLRWTGSRRLARPELRARPDLAPVVIDPGALGPGRPERRLRVSPQHRVLVSDWRAPLYFGVDEALVAAKALVGAPGIRVEAAPMAVEYFHLLFDRHELILTDGLWTESFYPGPTSLAEIAPEARAELLALFPRIAEEGFGPPACVVAPTAAGRALARSGT